MLRAIEEQGITTKQADVLILGSGGAARVAGYEFLAKGGRVTFAVRNKQKGEELVRELADTQKDGHHRLSVCSLNDCAGAHDLLINCTPVGMYPYSDACLVGGEIIDRCRAVFDAVYNPRETRLLALAKQKGIPAIEGLGMLFYQAVEAQKFWFGHKIASQAEQNRIYSELKAYL